MNQVEHMEAIAERYVAARFDSIANKAYYDFLCAAVLAQVPSDFSAGVFLELMCGTGELMARFPSSAQVCKVGVDLTLRMLVHGVARREHCGYFVCGDARRLPIADRSVHVLVIQGGLHHVAKHLYEVIPELGRVLVPGGVLICIEPCDDNPLVRGVRWAVYRTFKIFDPAEERGLRRREIQAALSQSGIEMEDFRPFGYLGFALIGNTDVLGLCRHLRWSAAIRVFIWADQVLANTPLLRRLGWLCVFRARKKPPSHAE